MSSQTPTNPEPRFPTAEAALIVDADQAFERDLPSMLETHRGQWVAYHGGERIGFDEDPDVLHQDCLKRGLSEGDFIVRCVVPQLDSVLISPWSFAEFRGPTEDELTAVLAQARENSAGGLVLPGAPGEEPVVIPLAIVEGQVTFARELASLLPTRAGQWVAYRGSERIGFDKDKTVLVRRCLDQGIPEEEFVVRCIEEGAGSDVFGTVYFPFPF